jgi:hypothetical protein
MTETMFDGMTQQDAMQSMHNLLTTGTGPAWLKRAEALALQRAAAALLDEADQLEFVDQLRSFAQAHAEPTAAAFAAEEAAEEAVSKAVSAERRAEDRHREALENQRKAAEAEKRAAKGRKSAEQQTEALLRARAAADVSARAQAAAEGARTAREQAEKQLAHARAAAQSAEEVQAAAYQLAQNPPPAPTGQVTALVDGLRRLAFGQELTPEALSTVRFLVTDLAKRLNLHYGWIAQGRDQAEGELKERAQNMVMPAKGHPLRPASSGGRAVHMLPTS